MEKKCLLQFWEDLQVQLVGSPGDSPADANDIHFVLRNEAKIFEQSKPPTLRKLTGNFDRTYAKPLAFIVLNWHSGKRLRSTHFPCLKLMEGGHHYLCHARSK